MRAATSALITRVRDRAVTVVALITRVRDRAVTVVPVR